MIGLSEEHGPPDPRRVQAPAPEPVVRSGRPATKTATRGLRRAQLQTAAFRLSRLATNVLALVCAPRVYYALTGCLVREDRRAPRGRGDDFWRRRSARVVLDLSLRHETLRRRLTDDQQVCDVESRSSPQDRYVILGFGHVLPGERRRRADEARWWAASRGFGRGTGSPCRICARDDAEALAARLDHQAPAAPYYVRPPIADVPPTRGAVGGQVCIRPTFRRRGAHPATMHAGGRREQGSNTSGVNGAFASSAAVWWPMAMSIKAA